MSASLDLPTFVARWQAATLTEKAGAQQHFTDLCRLLGQLSPAEADTASAWYAFEKGAKKSGGGDGWADVWRRGCFAWEYKGPGKDLKAAYQQLLQYREDLENSPLLVVSDFARFEVHTNFTGTVKRVYAFDLADLAANRPTATTHGRAPLEVLRALFAGPDGLRPGQTAEQATEQAAAHVLMRLLFCLFAEDIGLLPAKLFTMLVERTRRDPPAFNARIRQLFAAMAIVVKREAATGAARTRQQQALQRLLLGFSDELAAVRVLDPACGSGNFLYVNLKHLLDLEKEVSDASISQADDARSRQVWQREWAGRAERRIDLPGVALDPGQRQQSHLPSARWNV